MYHEVLEKLLAPDSAGEDQLSRDHGKGESLCTHHYLCRIRDLLSPASEELHYKALLLDTLDLRWKVLCTFRRAEVWSPMPWSLRSREEPSAIPAKVLDSSTPPLPTLDEDDLCHSNDPEIMTTIQSVFGSPIDIPWLDAPHDGYPFHATLSEYTQTRLFRGMHSVRDDFALWVSALTFGLLEVITQTRIPEALLLPAGHGGERVISGTRVLQLLVGWLVKKSEARPGPDADPPLQGEWRDYGRLVSRILTRAIKVLNEFGPSASIKKFVSVDKQQQTEIRSGIALTVLTLCLMARYLWHDLPEVASLLEFGTDTNVILHGILIVSCNVKMRLGGWCPYLVSRATSSRLLQLPLPYLSQLHRLPPSRCSSFEDHRGCTESSCVFYTIDATTYIPKHADSDPSGSCYYIRPPVEEVTRLLSEGVIPVIFYDGSRLHVRKSTSGPYVAISHVWADGMGSTTQAGLPRCVVERISGLATSLLPKHGLFWIDSLCIPVQRELRKKAIKLMASTYREAAKVLVVDAGIRATCSESAPREENLLRITFSGWNKRVWTLQEGLLARELWFEFIEGPVNIDQGLPSFHLSLNTQLARALSLPNPRSAAKFARPEKILSNSGNTHATAVTDSPFVHGHIEALLRRDQVVPLLQYRQEHVQADSNHINAPLPLDELMGLLQGRRTTKPEDETLAVSSLLTPHIDLDALLSITGDDAQQRRLKALLIQMHELPMVFTEMRMTRLTLPKFSWAPQALVAADSRWHATKAVGTCTENGFLAEYYLALLHKPEDDSQNSMEFASRIPTSRLLVVKDGMCSDVDFDETPEMASQHRDSTDAFLIINPENDFGGGTGGVSRCIAVSGARVALGIDSVDAVLPPLHTTRDTPIRLDYISSVNLSHYTLFPAYEKRHRTVIGELTKAWILLQ
ncbi:hypothetical protein C8Q79DRAFT_898151 [Trametes meyenii]|nr:hypothetical protein C8Q79DRAFT_898151 [Trametes meyenii]